MKKYDRIITSEITKWLFKGKALIITGARQVGKTTLLSSISHKFGNTLWLNADESITRTRLTNPSIQDLNRIIGDYEVVVIDEIQRIANAGLLLKLLVDNFKGVQILATGSSALEISDAIFEPMTGRYFLFNLYPFSLAELYSTKSAFELEQELPFHLVFGTYPELSLKKNMAEMLLKNLAQQYLYKDVLIWKDIRKPELLDKLLKLLAYQMGTEVSIHELANTLKVKSETIENYIDLLEKSFVIYRLKSYSTNQRKEVSKMSKILFWDNGIRNAIIENFNDLSVRTDQGVLFENFIIGERLKMNTWLRPSIKGYFWRNYNQHEVDFIELNKNKLAAFEMKWAPRKNVKITKAFTNIYPNASTEIITPQNFKELVY